MRFLVNKGLSAAARTVDTVSHSAAFGLVTCIFSKVRTTSWVGFIKTIKHVSHGCQLEDKMLTNSVSLEVHLMLNTANVKCNTRTLT